MAIQELPTQRSAAVRAPTSRHFGPVLAPFRPVQRRAALQEALNLLCSCARRDSGKINLSSLGAMQVSAKGDLANWMIPGKKVRGMGSAMDLGAGVRSSVVLMEHVAKKKDGSIDLKNLPLRTPPLTNVGVGVGGRIIIALAVLDVTLRGLKVVEMAPGVTHDEAQGKAGAPLQQFSS